MYKFSLEQNEQILKKGTATLHIDGEGVSGALYLTNGRLVFVGYVHGAVYKQEKAVSLKQIKGIKAGKTLFIVPNMLDVTIDGDERFKLIVQGRDEWLAAIQEGMAGTHA
jgi:stage V sporulation protein SpoVS